MPKKKKDGGIIKNWQLHHLSFSEELIEKVYPGKNAKPMVFTGTVVDDPTKRWKPGNHMRSSLIVSVDRENGIIETLNTTYKVQDEGNDIFPDIGDKVLDITY
ncbi:MAG: hypothetical protein K9M15_02480 [Candidatus Marinimicrobia bacterium]|nr:hypothetical protein [Candidatus Neomarinimicrobiota bacterium]